MNAIEAALVEAVREAFEDAGEPPEAHALPPCPECQRLAVIAVEAMVETLAGLGVTL